MKQASKIFGSFVSGLGLVAGVFFFLAYRQLGAPTAESAWTWQLVERKSEIARTIQTNKLLIAGGSSVLFGISAETIEKETGVASVNMGTHAVLPMAYHIRILKEFLRPGDTALLALEYEQYDWDERKLDELYVDYLLARDQKFFLSLPLSKQIEIFIQTPVDRIQRGLKARNRTPGPILSSVYTATNLNSHGDQTGHFRALRPARASFDQFRGILVSGFNRRAAGRKTLQEFAGWCRTNHIQLLATFPNRATNNVFKSQVIERVQADFNTFYQSINVPLLGTVSESTLPEDEFFDTVYHLTAEGQHARTLRLLTHLRPYLNTSTKEPSNVDDRPAHLVPTATLPNRQAAN